MRTTRHSRVASPFYIVLVAVYDESSFSTSLSILVIIHLLLLQCLTEYEVVSHCGFDMHFSSWWCWRSFLVFIGKVLNIVFVFCIFVVVYCICISSLKKCLGRTIAHFLSCMSSLYILDINSLDYNAQNFCPIYRLYSLSWWMFFEGQKFWILIKSNLCFFYCCSLFFWWHF